MNKSFAVILMVLSACGSNPDADISQPETASRMSNTDTDAGITTSLDYLDGRDGKDGKDGAPGPVGPQGIQGPQGEQGATGPQGLPGVAGVDGVAGAPGPVGPTGPAGLNGPAGPQGVQGPQGPQGAKGDTGATGPAGPAGERGVAGSQGPQGPQGSQGLTGATGPQGPAGTNGANGADGADGSGGYWVDATGTRAPLVSSGGTYSNTTLYVSPAGYMYKVHPMTGRLEANRATASKMTRYYESLNCTGRSWYKFSESEFIAPMIVFNMDPPGLPESTYTFARNVKIARSYDTQAPGFPAKLGSTSTDFGIVTSCTPGVQDWPSPVVNYGTGEIQFFYYIAYDDVIAVPEPKTIVKSTVPPYRFVPNI